MIAIRALPQQSCIGISRGLTGLPFRDLSITVNIEPLDVAQEIQREEAAAQKLRRNLKGTPSQRVESALGLKLGRIDRLMSNDISPFTAQFILVARDATMEGLQQKMGAVKAAISKLQSAVPYEAAWPTSARNYFCASLPGWSWDRYRDCSLYIESTNLSHLIPLASPATGLDNAEALYDGASGSLIGVSTFAGEDGSKSPQHSVVVGMTGSGKSMLVIDQLTQTDPYYDYTVIVDDGLSYSTLAQALCPGLEPIIVRPGGHAVLNYLDTRGAPLSTRTCCRCGSCCRRHGRGGSRWWG